MRQLELGKARKIPVKYHGFKVIFFELLVFLKHVLLIWMADDWIMYFLF